MLKTAYFILYVSDKERSARFYRTVLDREPIVDVPGITEFELTEGSVLGLMPSAGIKRLLGDSIPDPESAANTPRAELYLVVDDAAACHDRAVLAGASEIAPVRPMDWGHDVGYVLDPDCHVLAFAEAPSCSSR